MLDTPLHSLIIGLVLGVHMVVVSVILLSRSTYYRRMIENMQEVSYSVFLINALFALLGIFLVLVHNVWVWAPRVFITWVCWFILIRSVLWMASPERMLVMLKKFTSSNAFYVAIIVRFFLGATLLTKSFELFLRHDWVKQTGLL